MILALVSLIAILPAFISGLTNFKQCQSGAPLPDAIRIADCYPCAPCNFELGHTQVIEIDFTAATDFVYYPRARLFATSLNITGEVVLPEDLANVCNRLLSNACPLDKGESVTYNLQLHVDEVYPVIEAYIEILIEEFGVPIVCFGIEVKTFRK